MRTRAHSAAVRRWGTEDAKPRDPLESQGVRSRRNHLNSGSLQPFTRGGCRKEFSPGAGPDSDSMLLHARAHARPPGNRVAPVFECIVRLGHTHQFAILESADVARRDLNAFQDEALVRT